MAMGKTIVDDKGVSTTYHRIVTATQIFLSNQKQLQVNIQSYTDASFRQKEKDLGTSGLNALLEVVTLPLDNLETDNFSREAIYNKLVSNVDKYKEAEKV